MLRLTPPLLLLHSCDQLQPQNRNSSKQNLPDKPIVSNFLNMLVILRKSNKIKQGSSFSTKTRTLLITSKKPMWISSIKNPKMLLYFQSYDDQTMNPEKKSDQKQERVRERGTNTIKMMVAKLDRINNEVSDFFPFHPPYT